MHEALATTSRAEAEREKQHLERIRFVCHSRWDLTCDDTKRRVVSHIHSKVLESSKVLKVASVKSSSAKL